MATKKRKTRRNYKRNVTKSLKNLRTNDFVKEIKNPALVALGILAGKPIAVMVDKQLTAKRIFGMEGDKIKKWAKPAINAILGTGITLLAKDKKFKMTGLGLAASGCLMGYKEITGKDLLTGLSNTENIGSMYRELSEAVNTPAQALNIPLIPIDEPSPEASRIIDNALMDDDIEGIKGAHEINIGKTEEQMAGEIESITESNDLDMDDIP